MSDGAKEIGSAELRVEGETYTLPVYEGTEHERAVDMRSLRKQSGLVSFDPGYVNTGACMSDITFIDGEKGILRHRGYAIEDLAENKSFLEVAYMLIYGTMPAADELTSFNQDILRHALLPEDLVQSLRHYPEGSHPMSILSAVVVSLTNFYVERADASEEHTRLTVARLLGKMPTIAAFSYKQSKGEPLVYPRADLSYSANFLNMMFDSTVAPFEPDEATVKAIDQFFLLHADHEQNCSTSAVRLVGSSGARLYASISAGVCALWGPLHGGANQHVIEMLEMIHREGLSVDDVVQKAIKDKGFRLFGFGHRVYKTFDPRARIAKKACEDVLNAMGIQDPLLDIAVELEQRALSEPYFQDRNLYPNIDFYTGITLRALGLPTNMFTVLFAIGRLPGWIANYIELLKDPDLKIGRPRQVYCGETARSIGQS